MCKEKIACAPDEWGCPYYIDGECELDQPWLYCEDYVEAITDEEINFKDKNREDF